MHCTAFSASTSFAGVGAGSLCRTSLLAIFRQRSAACPRVTNSPQLHMSGNRRRALATTRTLVPGSEKDFPDFKGDVRAEETKERNEPAVDKDGKVMLKSMTLPELEEWVERTLGQRRFRARQLWSWMYKEGRYAGGFEEMTDLAKSFRSELEKVARIDALTIDKVHQSADGTRKILFRTEAGGSVESVLIPTDGRSTLCFSSQVGCAYNCQVRLTPLPNRIDFF